MARIVIIGGMGSTPELLKKFREFLQEKGFSCRTVRLLYHDAHFNEAPNPRLGKIGLKEYARDLEGKILEAYGEESIILIGWSMGGLLAQILATRLSNVMALILLAPAPPRSLTALRLLFTPSVIKSFRSNLTIRGFLPRLILWRGVGKLTFKEFVYSMASNLSPEEQQEAYASLVWESRKAGAQIGFCYLDWTKASKVDSKKVKCPVLVIGGKQDKITPIFVARAVAKRYGVECVEFDMAHWLVGEPGWEAVAQYCERWLAIQLGEPLPASL